MIYVMRLRAICIEKLKVVHDINPAFFRKMFSINNNEYDLRDRKKIKPKVRRHLCGTNTFRYQGSKLGNELPPDMKEAPSCAHFKSVMMKRNGLAYCCGPCTFCKCSCFKLNWPRLYEKKCTPFQFKELFELWKRFSKCYIERQILSPTNLCF